MCPYLFGYVFSSLPFILESEIHKSKVITLLLTVVPQETKNCAQHTVEAQKIFVE